jgi:hypothetical protein
MEESPKMPTPSELRARLESQGEELHQITHAIETRFDEYRDWRGLVRRHPVSSVAVAVGVGLLLSGSAVGVLALLSRQIRDTATLGALTYLRELSGRELSRL